MANSVPVQRFTNRNRHDLGVCDLFRVGLGEVTIGNVSSAGVKRE